MPKPFRLPDDPRRAAADVDREIRFHLEERAREFEAAGMSPEDARRAAAASFGDRDEIARECAHVRGGTLRVRHRRAWLSDLRQDAVGGFRGLRRSPGFFLVAALTLGLGIGGNTAIFSVVRSVLLAPLPFPDSDRLVQLWTDERAGGRATPEWLTPPDFDDWRRDNRSFTSMAAYRGWGPDLTGAGDPVSLAGNAVTWDFFATLGVTPALGRDFAPADDDPGAEAVAILADGLWRERFGANPAILGRSITLNGQPWTVIGVMPRDFRPPFLAPDIWRPMRRDPNACGRGCIVLRAIGRLAPGVTLEQARQDLGAIAARLSREYPETNEGRGVWLIPLHEQVTGVTKPALVALSVAVGFVLLIACGNLANLLLVRGAVRGRELAVRAALGAGRGRLLRQLLTESLVLAGAGGALGLALAFAGRAALVPLVPETVRQVQQIRIDATVAGFTAGLTVVAGLLFGLMPALRSVRADLMGVLRTATRGGDRREGLLRGGLVVAELALSVTLLVGAGLLLRSFLAMQRVELGFRTEGLVTANVFFPRARYQEPDRAVAAIEDLLGRLRASPAIRAAEAVDLPPLAPGGDQDVSLVAPGEPPPDQGSGVWYRSVSPGYLDLMAFKLVSGRTFTGADRAATGRGRVAVVNEETASRFWRGQNPLGRQLIVSGDDGSGMTVVGVIANARPDGARQPAKAEIFLPIGQLPSRAVTVILEPTGGRTAAWEALRESLRAVDPLVPVSGEATLASAAAESVAEPRTYATFVAVFATAALILAGLGVYGVMAFSVAQRQREIGVRLALGASPGAIRRLVVGQGGRLVLIGVAVGVVAAAALTRWIGALLYDVAALDALTFASVPAVLGLVTIGAAWIPARRATRVDPLVAMREE